MSINKLISIKIPIMDAIDQLGLDNERDMPFFTTLATKAEKEICSKYQFKKKIAVIPIEGCIAKIPADARFVQRAILGDYGCDCTDLFHNTCTSLTGTLSSSSDGNFAVIDIDTDYHTYLGSIPHTIQDNKIILNQNLDGQSLTIQYLGYETDEQGFLKVGENHREAIMWFIIWRYYFRRKNLDSYTYGKMNDAKQEWHRECSNARAKDSELTESERQEISAMLYDPYAGWGCEVTVPTF